ncbi:MAG TPA: C13 family peptidase [Rhodocyclaceae bacterium]|nr:C13 family peptidase [Rhodocyclaceae bacterium]
MRTRYESTLTEAERIQAIRFTQGKLAAASNKRGREALLSLLNLCVWIGIGMQLARQTQLPGWFWPLLLLGLMIPSLRIWLRGRDLLVCYARAQPATDVVEIGDDGLRLLSGGVDCRFPWRVIERVYEEGTLLLIGVGAARYLPIAATAFTDAPERAALIAAIEAYRTAHANPDAPASLAPPATATAASFASFASSAAAPARPESGWRRLLNNLCEGLRLALFRAPQSARLGFGWGQLCALICLGLALAFAVDFAQVGPAGHFSAEALPRALLFVPLLLGLAVVAALIDRRSAQTGSLLIALFSLAVPLIALDPLLQAAASWTLGIWRWLPWVVYYVAPVWLTLAAAVAAVRILGLGWSRLPVLTLLAGAFLFLPGFSVYRESLWNAPYDPDESAAYTRRYNLLVSEDNFYRQPQLLDKALDALQPQRPGVVDLYFVGMAGWAPQDVFMREVNSVTQLFEQRFGAQGHTLRLVNNADTVTRLPIASRTALRRSLQRVAKLMNPAEDMLFLFMTSHGSHDHKFSLDFGPMRFKDIDPPVLKKLLDESGIKYRVIVVSACYSGGFVDALKNDDTLVITAAARDRNSFGCSNENDYTYFGKAYFDEALRKTYSFAEAFKLAAPVIAAREKQEDFNPSQPQIALGKNIAPLLDAFAAQREKAAHAVTAKQ